LHLGHNSNPGTELSNMWCVLNIKKWLF
jgi:hypothetical protein